jgi:hypothetical protein
MFKIKMNFIKLFEEFESESFNTDFIESKMSELEDILPVNIDFKYSIDRINNQGVLVINLYILDTGISLDWTIDLDDPNIQLVAKGEDVFGEDISHTSYSKKVSDVDEALDMVEKEIYEICDISESYKAQWDSSIKSSDVEEILPEIHQVQEFIQESDEKFDSKIESILKNYDKIVIDYISDMFLFSDDVSIDGIIELGDKIMNRYGTEPKQVINAIEGVISYFSRWLPHPDDDLIEERKKAQRYKGKKIPGKYLTGPHPGKMKKEIDEFRGKKEYKKDWDADYKSGKGGKGKRVKTKKSAATKAYQRMFGDK